MAAPSPTTDPLWAYDTPAWTSQGNTGDTIGANLGAPGQGSMLIEPAALSGFIGRSLDPDVTSAGGAGAALTFATGVAQLAAIQVMDPAVTTKVLLNSNTPPVTPTYSAIGLYNATTGQQVAVTSTTSTNFNGAAGARSINWTASTVVSSGYYWIMILSIAATGWKVSGYTLSAESQTLLTSTSVMPYVVGTSLRFGVGGTGLTALAALPTVLTTSMVISANTSAFFAGIA
jgi:hypothetical protein